jgi:hypothetical protein
MAAVFLVAAAPGAHTRTSWPSRSTPLNSTLGWFQAINAHSRGRLLSYVAPGARDQMGWARPSERWGTFTRVRCRTLRSSTRTKAIVYCSFHESRSPSEGNPDSFWDIDLRHAKASWLIVAYGQG